MRLYITPQINYTTDPPHKDKGITGKNTCRNIGDKRYYGAKKINSHLQNTQTLQNKYSFQEPMNLSLKYITC